MNRALREWFFRPASPLPLAVLRIGVCAVLLLQAAHSSALLFELYGREGILQGHQPESRALSLISVDSIAQLLAKVGIAELYSLSALALVYAASLLALLVGWRTRVFSILAWCFHAAFTQGQLTSYGVDLFAQIALFYLVLSPCGHALSLDVRAGRAQAVPSRWAGAALRTFQIHLAISYFASGMDKATGEQWWNGEAVWRALMLPIYSQFDLSWLSRFPWLLKVFGWGTLLIEIGYPALVLHPRTRALGVLAIGAMHAGIAVFLGLPLFSALMIVLSVSAFGVPVLASMKARSPFVLQDVAFQRAAQSQR